MKTLFNPISHSTWIEQVTKDLRGHSLISKNWIVEEGISISNFDRIDLNKEIIGTGLTQASNQNNSWKIVESFIHHDLNNMNTDMLQALNYGVQDIILPIAIINDKNLLNTYLKDIDLGYIDISFKGDSILHTVDCLNQYSDKLKEDLSPNFVNINFEWPGLIDHESANHYMQQLLTFDVNIESSSTIFISCNTDKGVSKELATILLQLNIWSVAAESNSLNFETLYNNITISLEMESRYFVNIAKIRALKILLSNWSKMYFGKVVPQPQIKALIHENNSKDQNISIIPMTWKAMSAVIAGVDKIQIDALQNDNDTRRNARNIHHLLNNESHLHMVIDPAAGSHFIEQTTQKIALKSWDLFYNNIDNYAS